MLMLIYHASLNEMLLLKTATNGSLINLRIIKRANIKICFITLFQRVRSANQPLPKKGILLKSENDKSYVWVQLQSVNSLKRHMGNERFAMAHYPKPKAESMKELEIKL